MKVNHLLCMIVEIDHRCNHEYTVVLLIISSKFAVDLFQFPVLCQEIVIIVPPVGDGSCTWYILAGEIHPTH